jgi:hypothetical protein
MDTIAAPPIPNSNEVMNIQITWQKQQVDKGMLSSWTEHDPLQQLTLHWSACRDSLAENCDQ